MLTHHKVKNPIRRRPNRRALGPHAQAVNLRRIQPRHALHADPKEHIIQKEERHAPRRDLFLVRVPGLLRVADQDRDDEVAEALAAAGEDHHVSPAPALDVWDADQGEEEVRDGIAGGEEASELVVEADGLDEHRGEVVGGDVDARKLLHGLRARAEEQAADRLGAAFVTGWSRSLAWIREW